ncbi:HNH endonuclease [Streptomyces sp. NPDC005236]|uniref:HNH endonuclease n=1 Tax=Streptomyces sp. NPDC005236 TaxID=3157028 RepID=UPI0033A7E3FE
MTAGRPEIPMKIKRPVLVEAGHRCAIPTCRQTPVEIAHIVPWSKVQEHRFDNLIALCPTCHARFDHGDIDRQSMMHYKDNLEVINSRYTDHERQLLKEFIRRDQGRKELAAGDRNFFQLREYWERAGLGHIRVHDHMRWMLSNLVEDGIIEFHADKRQLTEGIDAVPVVLTDKGNLFLSRWSDAKPV